MTKTQRLAHIAELEKKFPVAFLRNALHKDAIEWRGLVAPNAPEWDKPEGPAT